jgi:beta-lactamase class A
MAATVEHDTSGGGELAQRIEAVLMPLGGRFALEARRLPASTPAPTRPSRALPMHSPGEQVARRALGGGDSDEDGDSKAVSPHPSPPGAVSIRADEAFPAASLAKLPIAVELLRRVSLGQFALAERLDTSEVPRASGGGVLDYLDPATRLTLGELCFLMLGVSDNTAANALLDLVGMGEVNHTLEQLRLHRTRLARRFMDFAARAAHRENVTSAADMVALLALLSGNALPGGATLRELLAVQQRADDLRAWLPEGAALGLKTGELEGIFHAAGLLGGPAGRVAFCVLTADQVDLPAARFAAGRVMRALYDAWCA